MQIQSNNFHIFQSIRQPVSNHLTANKYMIHHKLIIADEIQVQSDAMTTLLHICAHLMDDQLMNTSQSDFSPSHFVFEVDAEPNAVSFGSLRVLIFWLYFKWHFQWFSVLKPYVGTVLIFANILEGLLFITLCYICSQIHIFSLSFGPCQSTVGSSHPISSRW